MYCFKRAFNAAMCKGMQRRCRLPQDQCAQVGTTRMLDDLDDCSHRSNSRDTYPGRLCVTVGTGVCSILNWGGVELWLNSWTADCQLASVKCSTILSTSSATVLRSIDGVLATSLAQNNKAEPRAFCKHCIKYQCRSHAFRLKYNKGCRLANRRWLHSC